MQDTVYNQCLTVSGPVHPRAGTHLSLRAGPADHNQLFGWQIAEIPGFEGYPMWQAPNGISGGGLAPRGEGFVEPRSYVEVDSIDETIALAQEAGASVALAKQPITESSAWAVIVDPDGNHIGLFEGVVGEG